VAAEHADLRLNSYIRGRKPLKTKKIPFTSAAFRAIMNSGELKIHRKCEKTKNFNIKRKEIENGYQTQKDFNGWQYRCGTRVLRVHRSGSYLPHHPLQPHG
jgi:hypothetical protein